MGSRSLRGVVGGLSRQADAARLDAWIAADIHKLEKGLPCRTRGFGVVVAERLVASLNVSRVNWEARTAAWRWFGC